MDNKQKNERYKDLMSKLKKAMNNEFYYEAIFIEYAILEDRTESLLRHANIEIFDQNGDKLNLYKKLKVIEKNRRFCKNKYVTKHINSDLINSLHSWKNKRNDLIHDLIKTKYNNIDIKNIALEGFELVKKLNNKSTLVNQHFDIINNA